MATVTSPILLLLFLNALLLLAIVLVAMGWRGRLVLDDPRCARCRYDLTQPGARPTRCPECGADLSAPGSVRFGRRLRQPGFIAAGGAVGAVVLMALLGGALWTRFRLATVPAAPNAPPPPPLASGPDAFRAMSVGQLAAALGAEASQPWIWRELEGRLDANALSADDASLLCRSIVGALGQTGGVSDNEGMRSHFARGFVEKFVRARLASDDEICDLAAAMAGRPTLVAPPKIGVGERVELRWMRPSPHSLFRCATRVIDVRIDGASIAAASEDDQGMPREADDPPDAGPFDKPGARAIEVDVEWLVLPVERGVRRAADDLWTLAGDPAALRAAGAYAHGRATLTCSVDVVAAGTPLVTPVTDPQLRDEMRNAVRVVRATVTRPPVGTTLTLEVELSVSPPPIDLPMIMRPVITIGEQRLTARPFSAVATARGRSRSGPTSWRFDLPALDDGVRSLRLVLEPVLDDARLVASHSRAWGEAIEFDDVVVERRDLRP